jgi:hypothetical protein
MMNAIGNGRRICVFNALLFLCKIGVGPERIRYHQDLVATEEGSLTESRNIEE